MIIEKFNRKIQEIIKNTCSLEVKTEIGEIMLWRRFNIDLSHNLCPGRLYFLVNYFDLTQCLLTIKVQLINQSTMLTMCNTGWYGNSIK